MVMQTFRHVFYGLIMAHSACFCSLETGDGVMGWSGKDILRGKHQGNEAEQHQGNHTPTPHKTSFPCFIDSGKIRYVGLTHTPFIIFVYIIMMNKTRLFQKGEKRIHWMMYPLLFFLRSAGCYFL
jgi:hypothetical protein